jgi:hypothetical protein
LVTSNRNTWLGFFVRDRTQQREAEEAIREERQALEILNSLN